MSRSYKKFPCAKDRNPRVKKQANKRIRRITINEFISSGKGYKKYTDSWNICDWAHYSTWDEYRIDIERYTKEFINGGWPYYNISNGMCYRTWYKTYKMK